MIRAQQGASLVELMIVLTLSLVIVAGIIRFYISNKTVQTLQSEVSQIQTDARFSMELISREIRMADSGSCLKLSAINAMQSDENYFWNHITPRPALLDRISPISGWEATDTGPDDQLNTVDFYTSSSTGRTDTGWSAGGNPPNVATDLAIPNSDIINIMYSGAASTRVISGDSTQLTLANVSNIKPGDFLVVTDCRAVDIVIACQVDTSTNTVSLTDTTSQDAACGPNNNNIVNDTATQPFRSLIFDSGTIGTVGKLVINTYFVGKPALAGVGNNAQVIAPALFKVTNGSAAQPIIEGVESMQILYDGKPISSYNTAAMAASIKTIRLSFLMSTESKLSASNKQSIYDLNGFQVSFPRDAQTNATDHRVRRVYDTTVALRSQL